MSATEPRRPVTGMHDPATPEGRLGLAVKRLIAAVRRLRGYETSRAGQVSYAQYSLMFGLAGSEGCSARELAERADLTPATVTQMLEHLESVGLVTRTRSEADRRVVHTTLTERGTKLLADRHAEIQPRWLEALGEFSEADLDAATRVLRRLAEYFDTLLQDDPSG
ncbi:MAG: MarR family winged helix-turn-helix transcriptional regulator [Solirubrobacteraceae bacterium]